MKNGTNYDGVVVPMITPVMEDGKIDEPAVDRIVDFLIAGGVDGIFIMGTTGEGVSVPNFYRQQLVSRTVARVKKRAKVYVGIGEACPEDIVAANNYLRAGVDAIVSRLPISINGDNIFLWYQLLLEKLKGPVILYNIPAINRVSIPLNAIESLLGHPRFVGIKDSENNPARLEELLRRFGGRKDFSIFIGVGALMEMGLKQGAHGIVPSVGNLIPEICCEFILSARNSDWSAVSDHFSRMSAVTSLYQKGRTLNESLSALKAAMHVRGLCHPHVLPPLHRLSGAELEKIREQMARLNLTNGSIA